MKLRIFTFGLLVLNTACSLTRDGGDPAWPSVAQSELASQLDIERPFTLPQLDPDWTPVWWGQPINLSVKGEGTSIEDLMHVLANDEPVFVHEDVSNMWREVMREGITYPPVHTKPINRVPAKLQTRGEVATYICRTYDIHCYFDKNGFNVHKLKRVLYAVAAPPGKHLGGSMTMGGVGTSSDTGSSTSSETEPAEPQSGGSGTISTHDSDPYVKIIEPLLLRILDVYDGESYLKLEDLNAVHVIARPSKHLQVADTLREFNQQFGRMVRVHVSVFEFRRDRRLKAEADLNQILMKALQNTPLGVSISPQLTSNLDPINLTFTSNDNYQAALRALFEIGEVQVLVDEKLETRNNLLVTSQDTLERRYISAVREVETSQQTGNNVDRRRQIEIEIEALTTGWEIAVQPTIMPDELINLRIAINRNELVGLETYAFSDTASGSLPSISVTSRMQSVGLRSGYAKLISAQSTSNVESDRRLLGKRSGQRTREFAILIRAELVDN